VNDGLETEFADAADSPGLLLWRVTNAWQAAQRAALHTFDLTHVQFVLLASLTFLGGTYDAAAMGLDSDGGPVTQRDLANHAAHTDPMMTSQVLRALANHGGPATQRDLANHGGPVTQRDLANHAHTDPMMTSQVLRALETKGLVRRSHHPTDARARALTVTPSGASLASAANTAVEAADRAFFGPLTDDRPLFTDMLRRLTRTTGVRDARGQH